MKVLRRGILAKGGFTFGQGNYWPSVARLPDGRLAAVWSGGRHAHVCPYGRVEISYSKDEGITWSEPSVLYDSLLDDRDAGIAVCGDKVVVTTFTNTCRFQRTYVEDMFPGPENEEKRKSVYAHLDSITDEQEERDLGSFCAVGDGTNFGAFRRVPLSSPHGPIVGEDGNFLYIGRAFVDGDGSTRGLPDGIYYMRSENGIDWSEPVAAPPAEDGAMLCEPHGFVCEDGSVFVAARAHPGGPATTYFNRIENGAFGKWYPSGIEGGFPPHFLKLSGGSTLLVYGRRLPPLGIRAKISKDGGRTWGEELVLHGNATRPDIGYPASVELKDGTIFTLWYEHFGDERLGSIAYAVWEI